MARLIAKTPSEGLLPVTVGAWTLSETAVEAMTWIAPFKGREAAVSAALEDVSGLPFPKPGQSRAGGPLRIVWFARGQAMLIGRFLESLPGAAVADQTDGWAVLALEGPGLEEVLARLVPVDLRPKVFSEGATARTLLGHMTVSITRTARERIEVLVFRSMTRTAVHELTEAMRSVAARTAV